MDASIAPQLHDILLQPAGFALPTALLLGLLVALNPCQVALSVWAVGVLAGQDTRLARRRILLYAAGRITTYTLLGWALLTGLRLSHETGWIENAHSIPFFEHVEAWLPWCLTAGALYFAYRTLRPVVHHHPHGASCRRLPGLTSRRGLRGAYLLGLTLALFFCPESAILYFGATIPLCATVTFGWACIIVFALAASSVPVLLGWLLTHTITHFQHIDRRITRLKQWINGLTALILLLTAIILFLC